MVLLLSLLEDLTGQACAGNSLRQDIIKLSLPGYSPLLVF